MIDLDALQGRYQGEALIQRLAFIAPQDPQAQTRLEQRLQQASNVLRYEQIAHAPDPTWMAGAQAKNRQARDVLMARLSSAQANLQKDSIRAAYLALAEHDQTTGDLHEALHARLRAKDYCTTRSHTMQVSLDIIESAMDCHNYASVKEYTMKLEHTLSATAASESAVPAITGKLAMAMGLEALAAKDYNRAARQFAAAARAEGHWPTVLAAEETAMYAGVLALAETEREDMVALAEHPEALERTPVIREALLLFGRRAQYRQCWTLLEANVFSQLELDPIFAGHLNDVKTRIRQKSLEYYWLPYRRVEFSIMAKELGSGLVPDEAFLLEHMVGVSEAQADTRIDWRTKSLVRETLDKETARLQATQDKVRELTTTVLDDTYAMIVRLACQENDLIVADPSRQRTRRRGRQQQNVMELGMSGDVVENEDSSDDELMAGAMELDAPMVDASDDMNPEDLY